MSFKQSHPVWVISGALLGATALFSAEARAQLVRSGAGADAASIQAVVDQFRLDLGGANNGNTPGSVGTGRREINWDGGTNDDSVAIPGDFFNSGPRLRGAEFTTAGTEFRVSGDVNLDFSDINATYDETFAPFSNPRLFSPIGSNALDVHFFIPGTDTPALVRGFGVVFSDVDGNDDGSNFTGIEFFGPGGDSLGKFLAPTADGNETLSFVGVSFGDAIISRASITLGNTALAAGINDEGGDANDLVVMDDWIIGEPVIPLPPAALMALVGALPAIGVARRMTKCR